MWYHCRFEASMCWRGKCISSLIRRRWVLQETPPSISTIGAGAPCALLFQSIVILPQKHTLALSGKKPNLWIADAVSLLEEMHVFHFSMSLHSPLLSFFLFVRGFPKQNYSNPMISVTAFTHPLSQSSPIILMRDFMLARAAWSGMSLLRIGGTHGCVDPGTDYKAFVIQLNS